MVTSALRRAFWLICVIGLAWGCSNPGADFGSSAQKAPPPDPNKSGPSNTPADSTQGWSEVWEKVSNCGRPKCPGGAGFGVTADGHYYIGASSSAATSRGQLSVTEQDVVSKMALAAATQGFTLSAHCSTSDPLPGMVLEMKLLLWITGSNDDIDLYESTDGGKSVCVRGDIGVAGALRDALTPLAAKYDPVPLPSPTPTGIPSPTPRPSSFPWPFP